ncbi:photosystem II reaction center X protein [Striga asiatica]|uniref:Photosystem II reaction center X protein n=1 Tax=Striga asiatica TaxID=4170 RepID=A0A5A7RID8_STRAF|nr:photosystem II reaction center X protein [Striga asiatica]
MAATTAVSMAMSPIQASQKRLPAADAFFKPLTLRTSRACPAGSRTAGRFEVRASLKEKAVAGLTAAALTSSMVVPDVAEAASGVSPSLKNFLLSIVAGGVVAAAIVGAVIGVSNFDPVKRS